MLRSGDRRDPSPTERTRWSRAFRPRTASEPAQVEMFVHEKSSASSAWRPWYSMQWYRRPVISDAISPVSDGSVYQAISLLPPSPVYRRPAIARRRAASFFACFALCAACIRLAASISVSVADLRPSMISRIVDARPI